MTRLKQMESRNKEIVSAAGRDPLRDSLDRIRLEIVSTFTVDAALTLRRQHGPLPLCLLQPLRQSRLGMETVPPSVLLAILAKARKTRCLGARFS